MSGLTFDGLPPNREEEIFRAAAALPVAEHAAYLHSVCAGEPELRRRIERLLASHADSAFMSQPAIPTGSPIDSASTEQRMEQSGDRIGPYKLLEKVGEGGCGLVYVAEQELPVRRQVALKVIKLGMDTHSVIARFEAERQALAMMDHPNIAKVLDAGATDTGRPYFVMELVRGIRITEFCDHNAFPTKERLDLFIKVCQAIQHAHQKGIIHRDIKPSNILVTLHDGVAVPKVIDFGIAKATESRLTDATVYTQLHQFIGTPAYMSPEQAEMSPDPLGDIDTRSDIYSLGVLLYELLTGQTPFDAKELISQGLDAMRRTIRDTEPVRPSTRLRQELARVGKPESEKVGETGTPLAGSPPATFPPADFQPSPHHDPQELRRLSLALRGDLDSIVMKCLEKDRTRRYETANGLAMDVRRHLRNEPVTARPPSAAYRFGRLVRRHKLAFFATGGVVAALLIGFVSAAWQAVRATKAEDEAQVQAKIAKDALSVARRNAYANEINLAFQALSENNLGRARALLHHQQPKPGEEDLRGFEWRYLWQLCRGDEVKSFQDGESGAVTFSPDGRLVAYGGDRIVVREVESGKEVVTIIHQANTLAFSPGTHLLASSDWSGVTLWDTATWREARSLRGTRQPAVFSPDGHWLVTGAEKGFCVWNAGTWELEDFLAGAPLLDLHTRYAVAFSSDGRWLVTPFNSDHPSTEPTQFQVWDFASRKLVARIAPLDGHPGSAAISPDGRHLLTGNASGKLLVWDIEQRTKTDTLDKHTGGITAIVVAHDGKTFATASSDRTLVIWDAATFTPLTQLRGHTGEVWSVAMTPDGRTLASGSQDGSTKLWRSATHHTPPELRHTMETIGFSTDSRLLVASTPGGALLWDMASGGVTSIAIPGITGPRTSTPFSKPQDIYGREPLCAYGQTNGWMELWNLETHLRIASWQAHAGEVSAVALSPDGRLIASGTATGEVKIWDAATQRQEMQFAKANGVLLCLAFSPDSRLLAGSGESSIVWIWDIGSKGPLLTLDTQSSLVASVAFSSDGKLLAAGTMPGDEARLWEIPSGSPRATLFGHVQSVTGVAFTPDAKTLATGSHDRQVKLWNVATEKEVVALPIEGMFWSFKFSPDGRTLAVGYLHPLESTLEPRVRVWHAPSFEEIDAIEAKEKTQRPRP